MAHLLNYSKFFFHTIGLLFFFASCGESFLGKVNYSGINQPKNSKISPGQTPGGIILNLIVKDSAVIAADGISTTTLEVTASDNSGSPLPNLSLSLNIPTNGGSTTNPQITNSNGIATWILTSSTMSGSYSYSTSLSGVVSNTVQVTFTAVINNEPFITVWETTAPNETITLPLVEAGTYNFTVDWGDGGQDVITTWNDPKKTHTYSNAGSHIVTMNGVFTHFIFNNGGDNKKIIDIMKWGSNIWGPLGLEGAFFGCSKLNSTATDAPNLTQVTSLSQIFKGASSFNGAIGNWNTSNVINMSEAFVGASAFNQEINDWNTSNVTNMSKMFAGASSFNQDIAIWDTEKVTNMYGMFAGASAFNQNIGGWNTQNVTDMSVMFSGASVFNQDISKWITSKVTNMSHMFENASAFNQNIGAWKTDQVTHMSWMFSEALSFNQDISKWNTSNVQDMYAMFSRAISFNQNISIWNTAKVTNMSVMFNEAANFNQDLSGWVVNPNVKDCFQFKHNANGSIFVPPMFQSCSM